MRKIIAAITFTASVTSVNAALIDRGNGLIYDTDQDITWMANADYSGQTHTWENAVAWVSNLNYAGFSGWRLPSVEYPDPTCSDGGAYGYNCINSEMGHLFYVDLGGVAGHSIYASTAPDLNLFRNIAGFYWSGTEALHRLDVDAAWDFFFGSGWQGDTNKTGLFSVWAVHDGDIGASVVPVPAAIWLFGSGLLGLVATARRQS